MPVFENIVAIRERIKKAAAKSGRSLDDITLVAVTKNQPVDAIEEVIKAGIKDIGENRSQELILKQEALGNGINWHFIGHLQRNKVKYIIPFIYLIQSVDSIALAREISERAKRLDKVQDILLEVNISGEETKHGFKPEKMMKALDELATLESIHVKGLMTMAPFVKETDLLRPYFAKLNDLFNNLSSRQDLNIEMKYLSMGMSNDFDVAIEEGSNMVRIGTALFI